MCPELSEGIFTEPHLVELPSGRLVLHIRVQGVHSEEQIFTICQSTSDDGGKTWTVPQPTGAQGAPPHLLLHSPERFCVHTASVWGIEREFEL